MIGIAWFGFLKKSKFYFLNLAKPKPKPKQQISIKEFLLRFSSGLFNSFNKTIF